MDKPTEEQKKEFWEWCGFKTRYVESRFESWYVIEVEGREIPLCQFPIDLNNLFKYAVPKLVKTNTYFMMCYSRPQNEWYVQAGLSSAFNKDPALALFWALWQVKSSKEKPRFSVKDYKENPPSSPVGYV